MHWNLIIGFIQASLIRWCYAQSVTNDIGSLNLSFTDPALTSSPPCDSNNRSTLSISYASDLRTCYNLWAIYSQLQTRNADNVIARDNNTLKAYYNIPGGAQIQILVNNTQNFANITGNTTQVRFSRSSPYDIRPINLYDSEDCTENGFPTTTNASQWLGCPSTTMLCNTVPIGVKSFSVEAEGTRFDGIAACQQQITAQNSAASLMANSMQTVLFASLSWIFLRCLP